MAARVAIALSLAAFAWAGSARAEDDPSCAQYREPMEYNACLARHGPKANNIGTLSQHSGAAQNRAWDGQTRVRASAARFHGWPGAQRVHGRMHMEFQVR